MPSNSNDGLKRLHVLQQSLREFREQLDRIPRQIEARRQYLANQRTELEEARKAAQRLRVTADQKELQLKSSEEKIAKLRARLNEATTAKEFQTLNDQIAADTMSNSVLEDEVLEMLGKLDEKRAEIAGLEKVVVKAEEDLGRITRTLTADADRLRGEVARLEAELADAETDLPADARALYDRLVAAHGADALAGVVDNTCSSCYTEITPQMNAELLMGAVVACKSCGRLLYHVEGGGE